MGKTLFILLLTTVLLSPSFSEHGTAREVALAFDEIRYTTEADRTYRLKEIGLNAYFVEQIKRTHNEAVRALQLQLRPGRFKALIDIDMDRVDTSKIGAGWLVRALLNGKRRVEVSGAFRGSERMGHLRIDSAWLGSIPIPVSVVESALRKAGKNAIPPIDPTRPFQLPHGIRRVDLISQALVVAR